MRNWWSRSWAQLISRPVIAAGIAFGSLAIGGVLAVWPSKISEATSNFVEGPRNGSIAWWQVRDESICDLLSALCVGRSAKQNNLSSNPGMDKLTQFVVRKFVPSPLYVGRIRSVEQRPDDPH